jgi:hypothetical protein
VIGIFDALLIWAILKGLRQALLAAAVLVFGGLLYIIFSGTAVSVIASAAPDSLLFVPMLICRKYFLEK